MNQTLQNFYDAYGQWLLDGAPEDHMFSRSFGLCKNLWTFIQGDDWPYYLAEKADEALRILSEEFQAAGLDDGWPFGGANNYQFEQSENIVHLNPHRRTWVFERMSKK